MRVTNQKTDELNLSVVLSAQELQVATLVAIDCPSKQVADKLHISEWTVASSIHKIISQYKAKIVFNF